MHGVKSREVAKGNSDTIWMEGQGENDPDCIAMGTIWEVWSGTGRCICLPIPVDSLSRYILSDQEDQSPPPSHAHPIARKYRYHC